jgi:NAD(P) transhydrogenase subunit beta
MDTFIQLSYLVATGFFISGLKKLGSPATARQGNQWAAIGMLIGIVVTMFNHEILSFEWIIAGMIVGSAIGVYIARTVEMTGMPEMVALLNGLGGGASVLVAGGEYLRDPLILSPDGLFTVGMSVFIGAVTFTGSIMAYGKLSGKLPGNPITFAGQKPLNAVLAALATFASIYLIFEPTNLWILAGIAILSFALGVMFVLPIGGADMPVVISLLNSLSGVAASATGFVLNNSLLIVSGALVGASGFILTMIMCKAMNRPLSNVLFGAFGADGGSAVAASGDGSKTIREVKADDVAVMTAYASRVVIVPGYGLAVAQAQHVIREVGAFLEAKNVDVKYGIHPVAGRMPGHMNVLLAEANVPYPQLYDMDDINPELESTDVVLVVGANDVVNPAARTNPASPIYGMPILDVDKAKAVVILKRSMNTGFAGIDNDLFYLPNAYMYFGDAKKSLQGLLGALKEL